MQLLNLNFEQVSILNNDVISAAGKQTYKLFPSGQLSDNMSFTGPMGLFVRCCLSFSLFLDSSCLRQIVYFIYTQYVTIFGTQETLYVF